MKYLSKRAAVLLLEDGTVFYGKAAGKIGTTTGEICFNTGMTGYQEVFTDPSYFGQIVVMTAAHIGNYGVLEYESESNAVQISGLVCKNFSEYFSRAKATGSLQEYFVRNNIVAVSDIDTRALVRYIRNKGVMNAIISSEEPDISVLKDRLKSVPSMAGLELSSKVTVAEPYYFGNSDAKYKVAVLDLGVKKNSLRCLAERDCYLKVFPMNTSLEEMKKWMPDGILLTNGPGDPSAMTGVIEMAREVVKEKIPVFGICLGHQILASSLGFSTYKMHNGHRGINHPIKNMFTGKSEITSQNHGFVVSMEAAAQNKNVEITHIHLNDNTLAGLRVKDKPAFSVQYHPEAAPGPFDSRYLFDDFIELMESNKTGVS